MNEFAEIAVELPVEGTFSYSIPQGLKEAACVGKRVLVQFGKRTVTGYIAGVAAAPPDGVKGIKPLLDILDDEPIFDEKRLKFYRWMSSYYFAPIGAVLALIHPGGANIKSQRKITLTEKGRAECSASGVAKDILEAAKNGVTVSALAKRLRGKPVYSNIARLKKEGLVEEETLLRGKGAPRLESFVCPTGAPPGPQAFGRSLIQARVYGYLREKGETALARMAKDIGGVGRAVKKLEEKGLVRVFKRQVLRDPLSDIAPKTAHHEPNGEQRKAIDEITGAVLKGGFSPFLLYGVTGSGKTLVYLNALDAAVKAGKKAIFLSPEIALTPWPAAYLAAMFPSRVALSHSGLNPGERMDEWRRILNDGADIVVGARSALFSPIKDLGLIIVDEEHETSYKQDDGVRYNARDAALMLGKYLGITVVLGSATPSIETFHNAANGKLKALYLRKRAGQSSLPAIELMDMKGKKGELLSEPLRDSLRDTLDGGHQALLFLNRRGFSSFLICRDCGNTFSCLNCSVTMTMHKSCGTLKCHYCDLTMPLPDACPQCSGMNIAVPGVGTEKIEEEVRNLFPDARVGRMDRDTTRRKGSVKKILDAVEEKKIDILVGTQMVSKGHHFPGITLVGVVSGDTSLNIPDFRSSERTFHLITQAAGRAGRGGVAGKVFIQTLNPSHYCFKNAVAHDYDGFYAEEIEARKDALYPPFVRLCGLRVEGAKEDRVMAAAMSLKASAERLLKGKGPGITVLGPAPALLARIKNRFRWQMLIKGGSANGLHAFVSALKNSFERNKAATVDLVVDMDPITMI